MKIHFCVCAPPSELTIDIFPDWPVVNNRLPFSSDLNRFDIRPRVNAIVFLCVFLPPLLLLPLQSILEHSDQFIAFDTRNPPPASCHFLPFKLKNATNQLSDLQWLTNCLILIICIIWHFIKAQLSKFYRLVASGGTNRSSSTRCVISALAIRRKFQFTQEMHRPSEMAATVQKKIPPVHVWMARNFSQPPSFHSPSAQDRPAYRIRMFQFRIQLQTSASNEERGEEKSKRPALHFSNQMWRAVI